jgi:hypothetical protein
MKSSYKGKKNQENSRRKTQKNAKGKQKEKQNKHISGITLTSPKCGIY